MRLNFAGDVSDAAFYLMSETWFVNNIDIKTQVGILMYAIFWDDVFMILRDGQHWLISCRSGVRKQAVSN